MPANSGLPRYAARSLKLYKVLESGAVPIFPIVGKYELTAVLVCGVGVLRRLCRTQTESVWVCLSYPALRHEFTIAISQGLEGGNNVSLGRDSLHRNSIAMRARIRTTIPRVFEQHISLALDAV